MKKNYQAFTSKLTGIVNGHLRKSFFAIDPLFLVLNETWIMLEKKTAFFRHRHRT